MCLRQDGFDRNHMCTTAYANGTVRSTLKTTTYNRFERFCPHRVLVAITGQHHLVQDVRWSVNKPVCTHWWLCVRQTGSIYGKHIKMPRYRDDKTLQSLTSDVKQRFWSSSKKMLFIVLIFMESTTTFRCQRSISRENLYGPVFSLPRWLCATQQYSKESWNTLINLEVALPKRACAPWAEEKRS